MLDRRRTFRPRSLQYAESQITAAKFLFILGRLALSLLLDAAILILRDRKMAYVSLSG